MRYLSVIAAAVIVVSSVSNVEAGLGSLIGKAFRTASAKVQKVMGKETAKTSSKAGTKAAAKTGSRVAGRVGGSGAGKASAGVIASASNSVISNLGTEGALIASQLGPNSTVRLGEMAASIAKSPHRSQWLAMLGKHGGACVDFMWNHKQGIAVGVSATAILLKPADFLVSIGEVAETSVKVVGEHVVHPIVETTAVEVAKPMIRHVKRAAVASGPWWWLPPMLTCLVAMGLFWWKFCRT